MPTFSPCSRRTWTRVAPAAFAALAALTFAGADGCAPQRAAKPARIASDAPPRALAVAAPPTTVDALALPVVTIDRDNVEIRTSCRLRFAGPVADADGNGVVQVLAPNIVVDLAGATLAGCALGTPPERMTGIGICVSAPGVTLRNGGVRGFATGVLGTACDGALFEQLDLSENFAQRLRSSPRAEATTDWLWPHANDQGQWRREYGAALAVERARGVTIRQITAHGGQNGILLDRVRESSIYDNDCSFLSGWGIALWRSKHNTICRNAFDFCVRGYSHGIYNRGQDSAGILCFEQSSGNIFALNSATHCGDGFFGFAGKEALGETAAPRPFASDAKRDAWYQDRGCNDNLVLRNDFSDAAAHGIEMTFGARNEFIGNTVERAAICGLWGGYGRRSLVAGNTFVECGGPGTEGERGGINIEHGSQWRIDANTFDRCGVGVRLWWDEDAGLAKTPWARASGVASDDNAIVHNTFRKAGVAIGLAQTTGTRIAHNHYSDCARELDADARSIETLAATQEHGAGAIIASAERKATERAEALIASLPGTHTPVGARAAFSGRQRIEMGVYGPYDFTGPRLELVARTPARDYWRVPGVGRLDAARVEATGLFSCIIDPETRGIVVFNEIPGDARTYRLFAAARTLEPGPQLVLEGRGSVAQGNWSVKVFPTPADPRTDEAAFHAAAVAGIEAKRTDGNIEALDFHFGAGGPSDLTLLRNQPPLGEVVRDAHLPADHFGLVATGPMTLQPGCWRIRCRSDDGVRVSVDGKRVIDRWTLHVPTEDSYEINLDKETTFQVEVEYFELEGHAELSLFFEPCQPLK